MDRRDLDAATAARVIDTLRAYVTEARFARFSEVLARRTRDVVLVLEDFANAHNGAAVFRTAEAFGLLEVHVIETVPGTFEVSKNIARGADQWLDLHFHTDSASAFAALAARGYAIWVADVSRDPTPLDAVPVEGKLAFVFGNEREGPSEAARAAATGTYVIPMHGFVESFNVSVAAALTCFDVDRRRAAAGLPRGLEPLDAQQTLAAWLSLSVRTSRQILDIGGLPAPLASGIVPRPDGGVPESAPEC